MGPVVHVGIKLPVSDYKVKQGMDLARFRMPLPVMRTDKRRHGVTKEHGADFFKGFPGPRFGV